MRRITCHCSAPGFDSFLGTIAPVSELALGEGQPGQMRLHGNIGVVPSLPHDLSHTFNRDLLFYVPHAAD